MYISIPEKFFVPIVFVNDFFEDSNLTNIEEKEEREEKWYSRSSLRSDLEEDVQYIEIKPSEEIIHEEIINVEDMGLQYYLVRYVDSLIAIIRELEEEGCTITQTNYVAAINSNLRKVKEIYEEYNDLIANMDREISDTELEEMVKYFSNKLRRLYEGSLEFLDCPREGYERMERLIDEVILGIENEIRENIKAYNLDFMDRKADKVYSKKNDNIYK